jgi:zinc protease
VRIAVPFVSPPPADLVLQTPDKPNAMFMAGQNMNLRDEHPDYPALVLGGYMIGGGFLSSRLAERIRQRDGLSYGVGASLAARPIDTLAVFSAFAIFAPQNAERLVAAFREEIARVLRDGFAPEEIEAAKRGWMQQRDGGRASDQQLILQLQNTQFLGRTLAWDADLEARVRALTVDAISAAVRRHLDPSKFSMVRAGDFARPAAPPLPVP